MFKITYKKMLTDTIFMMKVRAKKIAEACEPGQFVIVIADDTGERIPLSVMSTRRPERSQLWCR